MHLSRTELVPPGRTTVAGPMVSLTDLSFAYPGGRPVFDRFTWQVARGEVWTILGPSGCGKSTLLLLLAGLCHPQSGAIDVGGIPLTRPRPGTSLILQEYGLLPWATVRANVELGLRIQHFYGPDGRHAPRGMSLPVGEIQDRVDRWLTRLDISDVAERYPGAVSGGQRQRVAIARAMAMSPDLLLMDEPFSSLDAPTRENLQQLTLEACADAHLTAVLVTHNIEEAAYVGQKVLVLGAPPNRIASVAIHPHPTDESYRRSMAYQAACIDLRVRMNASAPSSHTDAETH
jgi:ABC-type nitrate/sulfonate/bicarbonate transport system ATPase subunit